MSLEKKVVSLIVICGLLAIALGIWCRSAQRAREGVAVPALKVKTIVPATLSGEERVWDLPSGKVTVPNPLVGVVVQLRLHQRPRGIEFWVHDHCWDRRYPSVMFLDIGFNGLLDEVWLIDRDAKPHVVKPGPLEPLDGKEVVDDKCEPWKVWEDRYLDTRFQAAYEDRGGEPLPEPTHRVNFPTKKGGAQ